MNRVKESKILASLLFFTLLFPAYIKFIDLFFHSHSSNNISQGISFVEIQKTCQIPFLVDYTLKFNEEKFVLNCNENLLFESFKYDIQTISKFTINHLSVRSPPDLL